MGSARVVFEILTASSGGTIGALLEAKFMDLVLFRSQCFETSIYYCPFALHSCMHGYCLPSVIEVIALLSGRYLSPFRTIYSKILINRCLYSSS